MDMDGRREDGMDVNGKMDLNSKTDVENKEEKREERLNKWLGQMGVCSRREADRLIEAGKVWVDGSPAAMGQKVKPGQMVYATVSRSMGAAARTAGSRSRCFLL